jgi:hypothetical protein
MLESSSALACLFLCKHDRFHMKMSCQMIIAKHDSKQDSLSFIGNINPFKLTYGPYIRKSKILQGLEL